MSVSPDVETQIVQALGLAKKQGFDYLWNTAEQVRKDFGEGKAFAFVIDALMEDVGDHVSAARGVNESRRAYHDGVVNAAKNLRWQPWFSAIVNSLREG